MFLFSIFNLQNFNTFKSSDKILHVKYRLHKLCPILFDFVKFGSDFKKTIHLSLLIVWPLVLNADLI